MSKPRKIVITIPVMGGKARVWGSLRVCCKVLGVDESSVRRAIKRDGKYVNGDYCIYPDQVEFPVRNSVGRAENFKK